MAKKKDRSIAEQAIDVVWQVNAVMFGFSTVEQQEESMKNYNKFFKKNGDRR